MSRTTDRMMLRALEKIPQPEVTTLHWLAVRNARNPDDIFGFIRVTGAVLLPLKGSHDRVHCMVVNTKGESARLVAGRARSPGALAALEEIAMIADDSQPRAFWRMFDTFVEVPPRD